MSDEMLSFVLCVVNGLRKHVKEARFTPIKGMENDFQAEKRFIVHVRTYFRLERARRRIFGS